MASAGGVESELARVACDRSGPWHLFYLGSTSTICGGLTMIGRELFVSKGPPLPGEALCGACAQALADVTLIVDDLIGSA